MFSKWRDIHLRWKYTERIIDVRQITYAVIQPVSRRCWSNSREHHACVITVVINLDRYSKRHVRHRVHSSISSRSIVWSSIVPTSLFYTISGIRYCPRLLCSNRASRKPSYIIFNYTLFLWSHAISRYFLLRMYHIWYFLLQYII